MMADRIEKIVIVGGGTAGWMAAAAFAKILKDPAIAITLVESDEIGTIGVGESTIPQINLFNTMLGIDEDDFVRRTQATFKLGIEFVDWLRTGHRYMHPFGSYGVDMEGIAFYHFWLKLCREGDAGTLDDYSLQVAAARLGRFARPSAGGRQPPLAPIAYAFQFDATLYARYLRAYAEKAGVTRREGKVVAVARRPLDGFIEAVELEGGGRLEGELFVDCSGFRGVLIEGALGAGYEDWTACLPCDRAVAIPSDRLGPPEPYTRATAKKAGWQWRIPLQHRSGNGYVYSSAHISDDEAVATLLSDLEGAPQAEPRMLRFTAGRRRSFWVKNCVALGLAAGFLEPLESTSIHMVQSSIARFIGLFPTKHFEPQEIDRFNSATALEYERVRDFLILHYTATERADSSFWRYCRTIERPDFLAEKLRLFETTGRIFREGEELFNETSWLAVMAGQGIKARRYHPVADSIEDGEARLRLGQIRSMIATGVSQIPAHADFITRHCAAALA
jgi:tryptophan halogenase